jgi:hypothetical protein
MGGIELKLTFIPFPFIRPSIAAIFVPADWPAPERLGFASAALKLAILNIGRSLLPKMGRDTLFFKKTKNQ